MLFCYDLEINAAAAAFFLWAGGSFGSMIFLLSGHLGARFFTDLLSLFYDEITEFFVIYLVARNKNILYN